MTGFPALLAETTTRTIFEWGRIQSRTDWILPIVAAVAMAVFIRMVYRRDAQELRPIMALALTLLRTLAVLALLIIYLQPQWRDEQERRVNSRALVLFDNSLSMGLADEATGGATRAGQVAASLQASQFLDRLREKQEVGMFRFGEKLEPLLTLVRREKGKAPKADSNDSSSPAGAGAEKTKKSQEPTAPTDWKKLLAPMAVETRLSEAFCRLVDQQSETPISGVILITDGRQNAGSPLEAAIEAAGRAKIPVFPVGVGSDKRPANVRVSDFVVPSRAYPGDQYAVTAYLQAQRMAGQSVTVELLSKKGGDESPPPGDGDLVERRDVTLGADGEVLPVRFELTPGEPGRQTLSFKVQAPPTDSNPADNRREADVEIVDHKSRVLLMAGGPSREYQFLRNLLFRDESVIVDVLLQTRREGVSQEANELLDDFPANREEMFRYDCVVAIDPDWTELSDEQIGLLEKWVGEQGGGLVVEAGPVNMGNAINGWTQEDRMAKIRALYPVILQRHFATDATVSASESAWPLDFTREGLEAEHLWLADDATVSQQAWSDFPGVYACLPVDGPKPGATVLATLADPQFGTESKRPVYAASQFYGSGRVFYLGSSELWRLRMLNEAYFETIYTKLLRHVAQGRLLRGSSRGVLLVDRDRYMLGATVELRAQLTNGRLEPLEDRSVVAQVFQPDGAARSITLQADPDRPGSFAGRFTALDEGVWRIELPIPETDDQRLIRRIQVKVPDLERENPQRNDALLAELAKKTGGLYYVGVDAAFAKDKSGVIGQLKDRTKTIVLRSAPDRRWQETWLRWMMYLTCGLLFVEWLVRRLVKLA